MRGFSLIELLVAVLVIVILTSVVSLNVGTGGQDIERSDEVRQLAATMGYAQSEAELSGSDYGLLIEQNDTGGERVYTGSWLRRFDQGWAPPEFIDDVLLPFRFEPGTELSLALVDQPEALIGTRDPDIIAIPQIVFFAGGEVTEGDIEWLESRTGELLFRLQWDFFGRMTIMPKGEQPDDDAR